MSKPNAFKLGKTCFRGFFTSSWSMSFATDTLSFSSSFVPDSFCILIFHQMFNHRSKHFQNIGRMTLKFKVKRPIWLIGGGGSPLYNLLRCVEICGFKMCRHYYPGYLYWPDHLANTSLRTMHLMNLNVGVLLLALF